MRAEFYRPTEPERVLATTRWDGRRAVIQTAEDEVRPAVERIFRVTPVVVDDASLRPLGSSGEATVQPGSLEWFRTAALARAPGEGLAARIVPEVHVPTGWDPASAYATFRQVVSKIEGTAATPGEPEAESARPS